MNAINNANFLITVGMMVMPMTVYTLSWTWWQLLQPVDWLDTVGVYNCFLQLDILFHNCCWTGI